MDVVVCTPPGADGEIDVGDPRHVRALRRRHASTGWAARRRSPRSPTGPRRSMRVDVIVGPGQPLRPGGQAPALGDRVGIDGFAGPSDLLVMLRRRDRGVRCGWSRSTCSPRPSTAAAASSSAVCRRRRLSRPRSRPRSTSSLRAPTGRRRPRSCSSRPATLGEALALANAFAPEHLELIGAGRRGAGPRRAVGAGCLFVGWPPAGRRSATTSAARTTSCRPAGRPASPRGSRRATSAGGWPRSGSRRRRCRQAGRRRARRSPAPRASRSTPSRWQARTGDDSRWRPRHEPNRRDRAARPRETDVELGADPRRHRRGHAVDRRRLPRPHARPARPPRPPRPRRHASPATSRPAATTPSRTPGIVLGQALDQALGRPGGDHPLRRRDRADGRGARDAARSTSRGRPFTPLRRRPAAGRDRRLRPRAGRGVLPGAGQRTPS